MSTTFSSPTDPADRIEALLDQLVPRPGPPWRRFAIAFGLTVAVVLGALSWTMGVIAPNPTGTVSYSGGSEPTYVAERNAIAVTVYLPNQSKRTVRLTGVTLADAPGIRLVDVGARLEPEFPADNQECTTEGAVTSCVGPAVPVEDGQFGPWPTDLSALPLTVPRGATVWLHLLLDPTSCQGPHEFPWGHVDATFDFGDGGFPGWSRTIRVQDALAETDQDLRLSDGEGSQVYPPIDGRGGDGAGWLAAACRLIQDS
ncbi:MAG: hypothetical protein R2761_04750 [Acidimicrobiales bacterium]